jgi:hypothetical protein
MATEDENKSLPPSVDNGENAQTPPAAEVTTPDPVEQVKEDLAEKLKAGTLDEPLAAPTDPKPEVKKPTSETPPAPAAGEKAPEAKAEEDPDAAFDDPEDMNPDEVDPKFTKIRERIQKQQAKLREARKTLAGHDKLRKAAEHAGFDGQKFEDWVLLGARANTGDPLAVNELARRLRMTAPHLFEAPQAKEQSAAPSEADIEKVYQTRFKPKVDAYQMDEAAGRELAKEWVAERAPARPAPSQPQQQIPQQQQPQQQAPQGDPVKTRALAYMDNLDAGYAKAIPNWKEVKELADSLVTKDIQAGKTQDPMMWPADWQEKVSQAQKLLVKRKQEATGPAVRVADTTLRPSRGAGGPPSSTPQSKKDSLNAIAAALASGNLDNLPT